jgi:class 3 adenylate cyclase
LLLLWDETAMDVVLIGSAENRNIFAKWTRQKQPVGQITVQRRSQVWRRAWRCPRAFCTTCVVIASAMIAAPISRETGVNGLSAVAEAIDMPDAGDRAAGQTNIQQDTRKFAEAALANSKREGLLLAVRARWIALAVIAVTLPISNPNRTQNVTVLFADIVGFTGYADGRSPTEVIETLRLFHARMEREVVRHQGTLDKYLGDGLMATFGTPFAGDHDAGNALRCAQAMIGSMDELNRERKDHGEPPIKLSLGLHYGQVVLGDIGLNRLEFAVIGTTVNVASRLESLTRELGCALIASDDLVQQARAKKTGSNIDLGNLVEQPAQTVRGLEHPVGIWTLSAAIG